MKDKKSYPLVHAFKSDPSESVDFLVDMAIEFWRLEKRLIKVKSSLSNTDAQTFGDQMQRMAAVFEKHQIEIHDPKGEIYIDGRALKAIYIEEVANLAVGECRVIETIKPSVCRKGVQIFQGEVIVGQGPSKKSIKDKS